MSNEHHESSGERAENEAENLLRRILGVLGYDAVEQLTAQDIVAVIGAWLGLVTLASSEPTSPAAELWRTVYATSLRASPMATSSAREEEARVNADNAVLAFVRRFPCRFDPVDRQSLDDLAAMGVALDEQTEATDRARNQADTLRGVVEALQVQLDAADRKARHVLAESHQVRIERDALLASADVPRILPDVLHSHRFALLASYQEDPDGSSWWRFDRWPDAGPYNLRTTALPLGELGAAALYLGPAPTSEG